MLNTKHILFPTDFSPNAENALPFALQIAQTTGAELTLFHIIEAPSYIPYDGYEMPKIHTEQARKLIEQKAEEIQKDDQYKNLKFNSVIQHGSVALSILDEIEESGIDLVVIGTTGKSRMDRILYGSIATRIMLDSKVPVLAIPQNSSQTTFNPITFATDYREGDWAALRHTIEWADTFSADLNVLHISETNGLLSDIKFRGFRDLVREKAPSKQIHFDRLVEDDFLTGISTYLNDRNTGLLVLVRYRKNRLGSLFYKDHTRELSHYTKVPLLILPGDKVPEKQRN